MSTFARPILCALLVAAFGPIRTAAQTPPNVRLNTDSSPFLQNEEQIWINLTDSLNVIADWRDFRLGYRQVGVGRSTDGGATWSDRLISPQIFDRASDPCLVGDRDGRFFLNMLDYDAATPIGGGNSHIVIYTSTNGGVIWIGPVPIQPLGPYFEDKQFTATDRTGGPHDGNYYVSWTRFPNPDRMIFVRSTDHGVTFDDTVTVGPVVTSSCGTYDQGQFSIPIVNSDGSVHVLWQGLHIDSATCYVYAAIRRVRSSDGGATFTPDTVAFYPNLNYAFVDGNINVYGMPNGDADISGGPYDGTIYISQTQYADFGTGETDVVVRKSTDNGVTWGEPVVVNDDAPGQNIDQFHPWLIVNEDGVVVMVFYDQRQDPVGHYLFDCYFAASFDGTGTFTTNYRLSSVSSNPGLLASAGEAHSQAALWPVIDGDGRIDPTIDLAPMAGLIAEYIGVHAKHDYAVAVWTDTRDGTQDVYSARFEIPFLAPRLYLPEDGSVTPSVAPLFRWSTCWHETQDSYRLEVSTDPAFGSFVAQVEGLSDNDYIPSTPLPAGILYWRVKAFRTAGDSTEYSEVFSYENGCEAAIPPAVVSPPSGDTVNATTVQMDWADVADASSYRFQLYPDTNFILVDTTLTATQYTAAGLEDSTTYTWRVQATNACGAGDWSQSSFTVVICPVILTGDVDRSGALTSGDIIYLVNYSFKSGPDPLPIAPAGDVDCDGDVDSGDIIFMVNHVFKSGPAPCDVCSVL